METSDKIRTSEENKEECVTCKYVLFFAFAALLIVFVAVFFTRLKPSSPASGSAERIVADGGVTEKGKK